MKPLARYASLNGYLELCRSLGVDPVPLMRSVGLDPSGLALQDRWIPAAAIAHLLEQSVEASGHEDFGVRLAERRQFSNLGPLSLVVREEPDVRSALRVLTRYTHTYNEALQTRMSESNGLATLRVELDVGEATETRQSVELAVGVLHRLLRGFLGGGWKPLAVCFPHPAPADTATHRRLFGPVVNFDHEFAGIVIDAGDLAEPNKMSDPLLRRYTQQLLDSWEPSDDVTIVSRVRELIELLLPTGRCSVEQVARSLGVDRRTVHRRLAESGETFSTVLDATRVELAERMVANPRLSLTEIADVLAFSAPSNFSRWFSGRFGCSPSRWRAQRAGDTG
ncbi:AraC family transcriptional regulator [Rhodococcus opacus]|uniref:AraC family transcriptional regulator n=1 Tax=Rhodococcus opacus TaxID=37919 RepID=A0A1B1JWZ7_RHOOP|nr:AraC family transcriptional regulator [Rhodococcus opacus]NHU45215.1 AraC family transcriptional regulator [Rhodococcus sp. A14]ANS24876.1 AraC family transcriptional regulator [Rhodococcus opacus]MDJ0418056.1 AraC family transcriptional regulator [Rhodococcus opacus]MDV6245077.1 AraC family transcriptional regulator [Rhodococcus opacus]UNM98424.1 AraC family transcriptional regulator [Rhodococcus opacus]